MDKVEIKTMIKLDEQIVGSITTTFESYPSETAKDIINCIRKDHFNTCLNLKFNTEKHEK